jgi:hypothetical protein
MERESFILYTSWYDAIRLLSQEQKGDLLDAIFNYHISGTTPEQSSTINLAFRFLKPAMDANISKYQAICEKNQLNGKLGGRPKKTERLSEKPNGYFKNPNDIDNDIDNDIESDNYNEIDNKNETDNKRKGLVEQAQPSAKNNFIDSIIDAFTYCYKQNRNTNYIITARGKETKAAANILKAFKELHPDLNSEAMLSAITEFFNKALQLNDNFYKDSMSLSFINSQFNQISAKIASNLNDKPTSDTSTRVETKSLNRTVLNNNLPKELKEYVLTPENAERYLKVLENRPIHLIDYFINTNYDKLISMSVHDAAQYFVYYFKGKAEEQANAIRHYRSLLLEDDVKKAVDVIFEASIDLARPYIQSFRRTDSDTWFKEHIRANFIHYQERWQTSKNPEAILKLLKQIKEQQAKPSNVLR